jgi:hypothetical protein
MNTGRVVAGFRASDLRWNEGSLEPLRESRQRREDHVERTVSRMLHAGESRSRRGLGIQRCKNEWVPNVASKREGWFYDTFTVAAGAAFPQQTFEFAIPISGSKNLSSTNLTGQGGQMPAGFQLLIQRIRIEISNLATPADFANINANVTFEFKVGQVPIYQCMPNYLPAGFGCPTFSAANVGTVPTGSSVLTSTNNGMPSQNATYEFSGYPYQLGSQENFVALYTAQNAFNMVAASGVNPLGVGVTIRTYLDGIKMGIVNG